MKTTHQDIANRMGVSRTLVSNVLSNTHRMRISDATRCEVERVAREMGYTPRNMTTRNIALLVELERLHVHSDFEFVVHVERLLREQGYRLLMVNPKTAPGQELGEIINPKTVDGLLLTRWDAAQFEFLLSSSMPSILLTEEDDAPEGIEQIGTDLHGTIENLLVYLRERGHQRIALLSGTDSSSRFYLRLERAAREAAQNIGLREGSLKIVRGQPQQGHQIVLDLLNSAHPPTVVIAADVQRALLLLNRLPSAGCRMPEDVSFASLFDLRTLAQMTPSVTATTAGGQGLAEAAIARLLEKITVPETIPRHVFVPGEVVERGSVARLS